MIIYFNIHSYIFIVPALKQGDPSGLTFVGDPDISVSPSP